MITLNLIPADDKKRHAKKHIHSAIRNNLLLLFASMSLISIIILLGKIYLDTQFIVVIEESTSVTQRLNSPITKDIVNTNDILKSVKKIQDEFIPWHNLLIALSEITPDAVIIRQIAITQEGGELDILGTAQTREHFLQFKRQIEENELFINVDSPINNILKKSDINFTLGITIDTSLIQ